MLCIAGLVLYDVRGNSTRVDEGKKCGTLLVIIFKARTVVGRVEKSLDSDPASIHDYIGGRVKRRAKILQ